MWIWGSYHFGTSQLYHKGLAPNEDQHLWYISLCYHTSFTLYGQIILTTEKTTNTTLKIFTRLETKVFDSQLFPKDPDLHQLPHIKPPPRSNHYQNCPIIYCHHPPIYLCYSQNTFLNPGSKYGAAEAYHKGDGASDGRTVGLMWASLATPG